jgi:hypothetical protein
MAQRTFFGTLRLGILLAVLVFVALGAWLDRARSRDWDAPLRVTIYPIAADPQPAVRHYVAGLEAADFQDLETFMREEADDYSLELKDPIHVRVSHAVVDSPPALGDRPGLLAAAWWSLRMRWWAASVARNDPLPDPDVQVFALYHAGSGETAAVPDSVGLSKGLMAVAHLYALPTAAQTNLVVLAHEFLHTLGATDKYDPRTGLPLNPVGLGDADAQPLYPQQLGEIMAGRIALAPNAAEMPESLDSMLIGVQTAAEIGWNP